MNANDILKIVESYTSSTRAKDEFDRCRYYDHETKRKCAIGSLIPDEDAEFLEKNFSGTNIRYVHRCWSVNPAKLPKSVCDLFETHTIDFLAQVQSLHDNDDFWDDEDMSEKGLTFLETIKKSQNND